MKRALSCVFSLACLALVGGCASDSSAASNPGVSYQTSVTSYGAPSLGTYNDRVPQFSSLMSAGDGVGVRINKTAAVARAFKTNQPVADTGLATVPTSND